MPLTTLFFENLIRVLKSVISSWFNILITQLSLFVLFVSAWVLFEGVFSLWVSLRQTEFKVQIGPITKNETLPLTTLFFWKFNLSTLRQEIFAAWNFHGFAIEIWNLQNENAVRNTFFSSTVKLKSGKTKFLAQKRRIKMSRKKL